MSELFANYASTTLAVSAAAGDTTLTVGNSAAFPVAGTFRIIVDSEIMTVTAVAGNVFTVTRASEVYAGTQVAAAHNAGVIVNHVLTAGGLAAAIPTPPICLTLSGGGQFGQPNANNNQSVNHGFFWLPANAGLGAGFQWEAWIKPTFPG